MRKIQALLVEDSDTDALVIQAHLRRSGLFEVTHVQTLADARARLRDNSIAVVVLDLNLPDSMGMITFDAVRQQAPDVAVVILSGHDDEQLAIDAVGNGAQDYVAKNTADPQSIVRSLRYAVERQGRLLAERRNLVIESDLDVARRIQQRMLPVASPSIAGFDIAGNCQPAEACGGDFFDFIPLDNGCWDLVVADVSSHGFGSALIMVGTRWLLRTCAQIHDDVGKILTFANRAVVEDILDEHFITLFYARVDPSLQQFTFAAAGQPVWIVTESGDVRDLDCAGFPLGIVPDNSYESSDSITLSTNDVLVLATDGCYDAISPDGEMFGQRRMLDLIKENRSKTAAEIRDLVLGRVADFCFPAKPHDDVTLVLVKAINLQQP